MPYNYATAKDTLTEAETARIVCIFLNMDQSLVTANTNWEAAKTQIGSASIESLKKGLSNTLKKLDKIDDGSSGAAATPMKKTPSKKTPAKKTPSKKRKSTTDTVADDDDAVGESPAKKTRTEDDDDEQV